jgi:transglutaminase-like putative cysteine protease
VPRFLAGLGAAGTLLAAALLAAPAAAGGAEPAWIEAAVPVWVQPATPVYDPAPPAPAGAPRAWLVLDRQVRIEPGGDSAYQHLAVRLMNAEAVREYSQLTFGTDPSYQVLSLHHVRVWRDGRAQDRLAGARVTTLPQEDDIADQVYNGGVTVNLLLADVRVGDIVDYAYTVRSANPLFAGHFAARFDSAWSDAIKYQRLRIIHPASRPLVVRTHFDDVKPVVTQRGGERTVEWIWQDVGPFVPEEDLPAHVYPWPGIEISDMDDWGDVGRWASPVYGPVMRVGPATRALVDDIRAGTASVADRVLAAHRFVQEEIRYAAIAIGPGAHIPAPPDVVIRRRFGDCKDKSVLLVALLRELGVDAWPALVHTARGAALPGVLATPYAFNHVIVRAVMPDGRELWLDGTDTWQRGDLDHLVPPNFAHALVIRPGVAGLDALPPPAPEGDIRESEVLIDARAGRDAPATVRITTTYRARSADLRRARAARESPADRRRSAERYFGDYFPGLQAVSDGELRDDPAANVMTVAGEFRLPELFRPSGGRRQFTLQSDLLDAVTYVPDDTPRRLPLAASAPLTVRQRLQVQLPDDWPVKGDVVEVDNDFFRFRSEVRYARRTLDLSYEFIARAGIVPPEAAAAYIEDLKRVADNVGFTLYDGLDPSGADGVAAVPLLLMLAAFAASVWVCLRYFHPYDPPPRSAEPDAPRGIGGWLMLPAFAALTMPVVAVGEVWDLLPMTDAATWSNLPAVVAEGTGPWAQPAVLLVLAFAAAYLPYTLTTAIAFFGRRTSAVRHWIAANWLSLLYGVTALSLLHAAGLAEAADAGKDIVRMVARLFGAALWTAYLLGSSRVAATFVGRRAG